MHSKYDIKKAQFLGEDLASSTFVAYSCSWPVFYVLISVFWAQILSPI